MNSNETIADIENTLNMTDKKSDMAAINRHIQSVIELCGNSNFYVESGNYSPLPVPYIPFIPKVQDTCFHYTTIGAFISIVMNKTLRFGLYLGFNDADDGFSGIKNVNKCANDKKSEYRDLLFGEKFIQE